MIITHLGRKGSGKTELSKILIEEHGFIRVTFAGPLKRLVSHLYGCDVEDLESQEFKQRLFNSDHILEWGDTAASKTEEMFNLPSGCLTRHPFKFFSYRDALALIGTEVLRAYDPDFHVNQFIATLTKDLDKNYVVDDARFPNEIDAIKGIEPSDGKKLFLRVIRPNSYDSISSHSSETSVGITHTPNVIINNKSLDYLKATYRNIYREFTDNYTRGYTLAKMQQEALMYGKSKEMESRYGESYYETLTRKGIYLHDYSQERFHYNQLFIEDMFYSRNELVNEHVIPSLISSGAITLQKSYETNDHYLEIDTEVFPSKQIEEALMYYLKPTIHVHNWAKMRLYSPLVIESAKLII